MNLLHILAGSHSRQAVKREYHCVNALHILEVHFDALFHGIFVFSLRIMNRAQRPFRKLDTFPQRTRMFLCVAVYSCGPVPRTASAPRPCAGDEAPFLLPGAESSPRHFVEVAHSALRSDPLGDTVGEREFSQLLSTEQSTFERSCCLCTGLCSSLAV